MLDRDATDQELSRYLKLLKRGVGLNNIVRYLMTTEEFFTNVVAVS